MAEEDDIDIETLQAKIDMSLAFVDSLVASWTKKKPGTSTSSSSSQANMEKELKELMKRPPRLGVGAPLPESASSSHEAAKLRHQILKKKRGREDPQTGTTVAQDEDEEDEGESRAGAIRKKVKIDPFASKKGKQLQKQSKGRLPEQGKNSTEPLKSASPEGLNGAVAGPSVMKKNYPSKSSPNNFENDNNDTQSPGSGPSLPTVSALLEDDSPTQKSAPPAKPLPSKNTPQVYNLLNLDGPPAEIPSTDSTKKKRRNRKKKKKNHEHQPS